MYRMCPMAKPRKTNSKLAPAANDPASSQPLRGIEKVAWWSIPVTGLVALSCISALGFLYVSQPKTVASNDRPPAHSPGEKVESKLAAATTVPKVAKVAAESKTEPKEASPAAPPVEKQPAFEPASQTVVVQKVPSVPALETVSVSATSLFSLQCEDGKIKFSGQVDPRFVDNQPSLETTEEGGVSFTHLFFNGTDQSAELPRIPKETGSLLMVVKMPTRITSIFFDSSYQRLTLRKNRDGLQWRVGGAQKPAKIRDIGKEVNFNEWHHIVVTWKSGNDAILYVDGVEFDRYAYTNEQPQFPNYEKIVLGRTRGPGGRYYECRVHKFAVFDQPIPMEEVAKLSQSVRQTYPFIFK